MVFWQNHIRKAAKAPFILKNCLEWFKILIAVVNYRTIEFFDLSTALMLASVSEHESSKATMHVLFVLAEYEDLNTNKATGMLHYWCYKINAYTSSHFDRRPDFFINYWNNRMHTSLVCFALPESNLLLTLTFKVELKTFVSLILIFKMAFINILYICSSIDAEFLLIKISELHQSVAMSLQPL